MTHRTHVGGQETASGAKPDPHDHLGLVWRLARKIRPQDPDDLIGPGYLALHAAAERFEPHRGRRFSTYAVPHVWGAMLHAIGDEGWESRGGRERRIARGEPPRRFMTWENAALVAVSDAPSPFETAARQDEARRALAALEALPPRQAQAVALYVMEDWSAAEACAVVGCSERYVKKLAGRGLARLREVLAG